ncbi:MYXO-CTERM sorting domain-containing protein [Paraliomyxa miuraensis]|uniref:MYXO-CTERM sorting domain-containing protein n=1 Tax=Paraliomyxa miuraensis TaxID=376150 RepID=UPI002251B59A|nr:MYXO-CTERM sorting domain-containing protein [Paraliomyxa miuraensis]MCX4239989.1 MYXO-CTERM sorting domain-containing protein [Paraliomyxa miuraensis]
MLGSFALFIAWAPAAGAPSDLALPLETPAIPTAELRADLPPRAAGTPETLFINFDGGVLQTGCGNDPRYDCSTLANLFNGYVGPYDGNETQRISILQATRKDLKDFGVRVVVDRPPEDVPYTMVMYGDLGPQSFAGVAPYIDCEDRRGSDTSFTQGFGSSNTGSTVILQEAAHTWGLEHVDAELDILNPFKSAGLNQSFRDECFRIVSDTDLTPTPGSCNQVHTQFCETGHQNSWQEMNLLFGPAIPDTTAPTLEITSPEDESTFVLPTTIALLGEVQDDLHPQFYRVEVYDHDQLIYTEDRIGLDLLLINPPEGDYDLRVVIADEAGNTGEDRVRFTILPEGSELPPEPEEEDPGDPTESGCRIGGEPEPAPAWAMLALLVLVRARRA